jgi:hypothetical protein
MIIQNSERIFLQPIDQLYDNHKTTKDSPEEDQSKFFDDYTHGVIDYLNISTDSETRNNSINEEINGDGKLTEILSPDWKNKVDYFKTFQLCVMRSFVFQKMHFMRNTLNATMSNRSLSCPSVVTNNQWCPVNPFNLCKNVETCQLDDVDTGHGIADGEGKVLLPR